MSAAPADAVHWPTLRSKLWPVTIVRLLFWGWGIHWLGVRNWYYGYYFGIEIGPWWLLFGACHLRERP